MVRKSPDAFRTISEVAEILEIPAHVLRFWESRFTQIKPVKRGGGRRYYRPLDIDLLRGIRDLLYHDGMTIKGVQKILRERGVKHVTELGRLEPQRDPIHAPQDPPLRRPAAAPAAEFVPEFVPEPDDTRPEPVPEAPFWAEPEDDSMDQPEPPAAGRPEAPEAPFAVLGPDDDVPDDDVPDDAAPRDVPDEPGAQDTPETAQPAAQPAAPSRPDAPPMRSFPDAALPGPGRQPRGDTQVDLFSHAEKRDRRPFPPDPARAARTEELRRILGKLEALREKMAATLR
ncbi:MerR family transcriptional regulator [Halovulum marinum]|uniref:MerR family transcriptional regulator n=1 Tax=Halovulum marinum TaxID=2662447 RepID=UPI002D76BC63|nr:MerR family transcriptional regulator [Halovulum marinum]